ncbi:yellow-g [Carabus blaptoides fortunei]
MAVRLVLAATLIVAGVNASCDEKQDRNLAHEMTVTLNGANLEWPCLSTRNIYMQSGRYISRNVIATRTQIYNDQVFVALPRYKSGVPFTLGTFSLASDSCLPTIKPYPCWPIQEEGNCHALQSVVDLHLCGNNILWVLDVGIVNTLEQPVRRCPPKVVGISVKTGKVVKVIDLSGLVTSASRLQYLVVDHASDGRAFVYISDAATRAILVYDISACKGYRVVLPKAVTAGCARRDVLYIQLIRKSCGNVLFFTYLSSSRLYSIKTSYLRKGQCSGAVVDVGAKPQGQKIVLLGTDNGANLFFRPKGESDIYVWNSNSCFKSDNWILAQKGGECRLATQVIPGYKKMMWTIESNFHDYITNSVGCVGASVLMHPMTCDDTGH